MRGVGAGSLVLVQCIGEMADARGHGDGDLHPSVHHLFVYGNTRPDIAPAISSDSFQSTRAWLLGSRLYSCNTKDGRNRAAVRLDEAGHAVLGYTVSLRNANSIHKLLDTFEKKEYSPEYYERDVVEVVTEGGERVQSFVYHCPQVDISNPVQGGDWLQHIHQ